MDNQELWRCHFLGSHAPWAIHRPIAHRAAFVSKCPRALMVQARESLGEANDVGTRPLVEDLLRLPQVAASVVFDMIQAELFLSVGCNAS
jgi:hypothetical protein